MKGNLFPPAGILLLLLSWTSCSPLLSEASRSADGLIVPGSIITVEDSRGDQLRIGIIDDNSDGIVDALDINADNTGDISLEHIPEKQHYLLDIDGDNTPDGYLRLNSSGIPLLTSLPDGRGEALIFVFDSDGTFIGIEYSGGAGEPVIDPSYDTVAPVSADSSIRREETIIDRTEGRVFLRLSWQSAADNLTSAEDIRYDIVSSLSDFTDLAELDGLISRGQAFLTRQDIRGATSVELRDLESNRLYFIAVIARDQAANRLLYNRIRFNSALYPYLSSGDNKSLVFTPEADGAPTLTSGFSLSWTELTDDQTPADISYRTYILADQVLGLAQVEDTALLSYSLPAGSGSPASIPGTGLSPDSGFWVYVAGSDPDGNSFLFDPVRGYTASSVVPESDFFWEFDGDADSIRLPDSIGETIAAESTTAANFLPDRFGTDPGSLSFSGAGEYVDTAIGNDGATSGERELLEGDYSISLWVQFFSGPLLEDQYQNILYMDSNDSDDGPDSGGTSVLAIRKRPDQHIEIILGDPANPDDPTILTSGGPAELNRLYNLAVVKSQDRLRLYVDGLPLQTAFEANLQNRTFSPVDLAGANGNIVFGRAWDGAEGFYGILDDVRIWSREVSEREILQNYRLLRP